MQGVRNVIVCVGIAWSGVALAQRPDPAATPPKAQYYKDATAQYRNGNHDKALALIEQGLAAAPKDPKLLSLKEKVFFEKGNGLLDQRDYTGALDAFDEYLKIRQTGQDARTVKNIVRTLSPARTTSFEISVANGLADIYLEAKTLGVVCAAARSCNKAWLPGDYKVIAERDGFLPWTGELQIAKGQAAKLTITLVDKPSLLSVQATPPGAQITLDGAPYDKPIEIAPGPHRIVVSLAGHVEQVREIKASEGKPIEMAVGLAPIPPPVITKRVAVADPKPQPHWLTTRRKLALAAAGVGVVAAGAGVALGLDASRLEDDAYALCPSPAMPCADAADANDLMRRGESRALQANIAYTTAGVAVLAALGLWFTGAPESNVAVTPRLGALAGLDLSVRF